MMEKKQNIISLIAYFKIFLRLAKWKFLALPVLMVLAGVFDSIGIVMFFPLLEKMNHSGQEVSNKLLIVVNNILQYLNIYNLERILLFICIVFLIKFIITFFQEVIVQKLMRKMYRQLSSRIIDGWGEADYQGLYLDTNTGYFTNVLIREIWVFLGGFKSYCACLVSALYIAIYLGVSLALDVKITVIAASSGIVIIFFLKYFARITQRYAIRYSRESALFQNRIVEYMHFYKYLKSTFQSPRIEKSIKEHVRKLTSFQYVIGVINYFVSLIPEPIVVVLVVGFLYLQMVVWQKDFSTIVVLILLFYRILMRITKLQGSWQTLAGAGGGTRVILELLEKINLHKEKTGGIKGSDFSDSISLEHVNFSYADKQVLFDLNMKFEKNKTVALVGPSGTGKSTIVDLLTGVLKPCSGAIRIDGLAYSDWNIYSLRKLIGYVTQEIVIFNDTIMNNVSFWDKADADVERRVKEACQKALCSAFIEKMPLQYNTVIGDRGIRLSVGQRQRVAIARELYRGTKILILDEATSALDTESENCIKESIEELKGNKTIIIIAHRLSTVKSADYIYVIDKGRIIEQGGFDDLYKDEKSKLYQMCRLQSF